MLLLCLASPSRGAIISEVFFAGFGPSPDAVELDHLHTVAAPAVDLVVLGASPWLGPIIVQVVTIPTTANTVLVSETAWPSGYWNGATGSAMKTLGDLGAGSDWRFALSRTLVLFDRKTSLVANNASLQTQLHLLNGAVALDWITFARDESVTAWNGEDVIDAVGKAAISLPRVAGEGVGPAISGTPNAVGYYTHLPALYGVTPGWPNPTLPAHTPEPGTLGLLGAAALFCAAGRSMMGDHVR